MFFLKTCKLKKFLISYVCAGMEGSKIKTEEPIELVIQDLMKIYLTEKMSPEYNYDQ